MLRLLVQVAGLAAQGDPVCLAVSQDVAGSWIDWIAERLDVPDTERRSTAAAVLVIIDGLAVLVALGLEERRATVSSYWMSC